MHPDATGKRLVQIRKIEVLQDSTQTEAGRQIRLHTSGHTFVGRQGFMEFHFLQGFIQNRRKECQQSSISPPDKANR